MTLAKPPPSQPCILVVVDPAASQQPALRKAARLAVALRARVEVYACDWREGLAGNRRPVAAARRSYLTSGHAMLAALARTYIRAPRRLQVRYELGHPRETRILAAIRRLRPKLVVIDSHFHVATRRTLFGPADWPLIRDCPVPLLYAKPARWHSAPRIAAAVDPRHPAEPRARLDERVVSVARHLARSLGGSLHVVNAWLPLDPALAGPAALGLAVVNPADIDRLVTAEEAATRAAVRALLRGGGPPRAEIVLLRGAAVETLPGFADLEGLDVLVMGAVSRSRLYEALVGATAERLLEQLPCDVLIVKGPRRPARRAAGRRASRRIPV